MPGRLKLVSASADPPPDILPVTHHLLIGRDPQSHVVLAEPSVSRRHAQIEMSGDGLYLRDLSSRNGTYLEDGTRITDATPIQPGTLFRLGRTWLKVDLVD